MPLHIKCIELQHRADIQDIDQGKGWAVPMSEVMYYRGGVHHGRYPFGPYSMWHFDLKVTWDPALNELIFWADNKYEAWWDLVIGWYDTDNPVANNKHGDVPDKVLELKFEPGVHAVCLKPVKGGNPHVGRYVVWYGTIKRKGCLPTFEQSWTPSPTLLAKHAHYLEPYDFNHKNYRVWYPVPEDKGRHVTTRIWLEDGVLQLSADSLLIYHAFQIVIGYFDHKGVLGTDVPKYAKWFVINPGQSDTWCINPPEGKYIAEGSYFIYAWLLG